MPELRQNDLTCVRQVCRKLDKFAESQAKVDTRPTEAAQTAPKPGLINAVAMPPLPWVVRFDEFLCADHSADSKRHNVVPSHVIFSS